MPPARIVVASLSVISGRGTDEEADYGRDWCAGLFALEQSKKIMPEDLMWLEWERLNAPVEFEPEQHGPLPAWVKTVTVRRKGVRLELDTVGSIEHVTSLDPPERKLRVGEQLPRPPSVIGSTKYGERVAVDGVYLRGIEMSGSAGRVPARVESLTIGRGDSLEAARFEWIANYSVSDCAYPRLTNKKSSKKLSIERDGFPSILIDFDKPWPRESSNRNHFRLDLQLEGVEGPVLVGEGPKEAPADLRPGFIYWNPAGGLSPTEDVRGRIVAALSFMLGRQVTEIGYTTFSDSWSPIVAGASEARLVQEIPQASYPPAPLYGGNELSFIDERHASLMVSKVASSIDRLDLEHALWLYWLALSSPLDVQPAHLGAALEALRDACLAPRGGLSTALVETETWELVREALLKELDVTWRRTTARSTPGMPHAGEQNSAEETSDSKLQLALKVFQRKISQLNDKSGRMRWEDFFDGMGLPTGKVEFAAINHRHGPAHGARYQGDYKKLGATVHALQALFNRCVLKLTGGAEVYVDYSTYDFPVRALNDPLGGPEGNGKPASE